MVGCNGIEVTAGWEVEFTMNGPEVGMAPDVQTGLW